MRAKEFGDVMVYLLDPTDPIDQIDPVDPTDDQRNRANDVADVTLEAYAARTDITLDRGELARRLRCNPDDPEHTRDTLENFVLPSYRWAFCLLEDLPHDVRRKKEFASSLGSRVVAYALTEVDDGRIPLVDVHTHPAAQKNGLATALVRASIEAAFAASSSYTKDTPVELSVIYTPPYSPRQFPASLYTGIGFQDSGRDGSMLEMTTRLLRATVEEVRSGTDVKFAERARRRR